MFKELSSRGTPVHPHPIYIKGVGDLLSRRALGEEERKLLTDWFELVPDIQSSTSAPTSLEFLLDDLRHHVKADSALAVSIGRVLARKGYKTLVECEVLPLVKSSFGSDVFSTLLQETSQLYVARSASNRSEVFEDTSEDYNSLMATSPPSPPSVLELVEMSLPHTLPSPDPSNQSVFEELDDDYVAPTSTPQHFPHQSPAAKLEQLVKELKYDDALQLLSELVQLDAPISFSHVYEFAVLDALKRPFSADYTPDVQLKLFTSWLSLIPFEHEHQPQSRLHVIQRTIMLAPVTNLPLIMRYCTILSAKGYVNLVGRQEIAVVMRFAPTDEINKFIQKLESANTAYWERFRPKSAAVSSTDFKSRVRSLSIRYMAYSGRVEEAIGFIPERGSKIRLDGYTLAKLFRTIRDINNPSFAQYLPRVEKLLRASSPDHEENLRQLCSKGEEAALAAELQLLPTTARVTLSQTLRHLKRVLRTGQDVPHPFVIADFLERYLATGRTRAPNLLLNLCLNSSYHSTSIFLYAEMLYYQRMGLHTLIIKTFVDHFYISGVPRDDVLQLCAEAEHRSDSPDDDSNNDNYNTRMCNFSPSQLPRGKAWPQKYHCNIVWHALVALTPSLAKLPVLYYKLLDIAEGSKTNSGTAIAPLTPPPSSTQPIDSAAFTPFMRQMMWISGPDRGYGIIRDIFQAGLQPTVYHYTEVAGYCARMGLVGPAMELLHYLEQSSPAEPQTEPQTIANNQTPTETVVPEPDLVFYISLMRGFILSQSSEAFQKVHKRLIEIQQYLPKQKFPKDQKEMLDYVYADFRIMSRKLGYDYKTERRSGYRTFMDVRDLSITRFFP
ncbi:hypothetical protein AGABI1DRAFT_77475 [Agaricus bisporus var. burnettii JB137-S8]|uniref:Pentacotripeptide-repeat region of PRORP domain-containing protein n=1 Tax=Agaricus bisporus var. burnettii (strain JB137-S8 / ATCC MYA-4627 / FGSC 10392) TaxID=597362 RepID=K5VSI8_AGABU|nr:uncharacterized protein AGABI1DRAFT_77475 [Agaricus bisporus var. burnettii JB137-S8]EKM77424.1 hypothetical protein AGABI1DRAFT_77475 [Agaricus bisporus var. burnettii JB137-S8]